MLDLKWKLTTLKKDINVLRKNPFKAIILLVIIIIGVIFVSFLWEKWKQLATNTEYWQQLEISQMIFSKEGGKFILEFTVKNFKSQKILVKSMDITLSKILPDSWWGWPLDMDTKYSIVFNESLLVLNINNKININNTPYIAYVRDYNNGLTDDLILKFQAPFVLHENYYTPFRIEIPDSIFIRDIQYSSPYWIYSPSEDVFQVLTSIPSLWNLNDLDSIIHIAELGGIYITLETDNRDYPIIEWVKTFMDSCWEPGFGDCETTYVRY